jgi:hypothetical protein
MLQKFAEMSVGELVGSISAIVVAASVVIQISPIKFSPWTWLARKFGKAINGEVIEKVDRLKQDMDNMKAQEDERNAKTARSRILRFGDELLHDQMHSKDHFDDIMMCITEYTQYCNEHPEFKNHITETTTRHILHTYEKCLEEHSFL